ncbi:type II toxin-antitoxin system RelE/ParE family toxin [Sphingomonas sp. R647]|uniref:type II toxin-antitoxin system RelE/ParE family toxin n=1 Tax=Sphingomonas sp. R647 TaxID=2875233 RepID=UPI001CD6C351|nr:type II toxin-antitoxin system RelE/ParE family toxin [Sphingomonas sp. R647]MCA1197209.1 type II toxin-antitoxin system RelE/ParE family toxin [Sphingomonas sp. R647]
MTSLRVTPRAFEDLKTIGRYTLRQWGRQQRDAYVRGLDARFAWLAEHPMLGRARDEIAPGYRSFRHEAHVIFYQIRADGIDIIGVPHQAMDMAARLGTDPD